MMTMMMMMRRRKQNAMLKTTCVHIALDYHHIDSWFMIYCDSQRQLTWAVHRSACNAQKHFSRSSIIRLVMIGINTIVIIFFFFIFFFSPSSFITYWPLRCVNFQGSRNFARMSSRLGRFSTKSQKIQNKKHTFKNLSIWAQRFVALFLKQQFWQYSEYFHNDYGQNIYLDGNKII